MKNESLDQCLEPRPVLAKSETKTKTGGCRSQDRDHDLPLLRLSQDQDRSLKTTSMVQL